MAYLTVLGEISAFRFILRRGRISGVENATIYISNKFTSCVVEIYVWLEKVLMFSFCLAAVELLEYLKVSSFTMTCFQISDCFSLIFDMAVI